MPVDPKRTQHDPNAGATPNRASMEASLDSFPASDPPNQTNVTGARAVPPSEVAESGSGPGLPDDAVTLAMRFPSHEAAKLAVEALVREGPIDRHCAEIVPGQEPTTVRVAAPKKDTARLTELMHRHGGKKA